MQEYPENQSPLPLSLPHDDQTGEKPTGHVQAPVFGFGEAHHQFHMTLARCNHAPPYPSPFVLLRPHPGLAILPYMMMWATLVQETQAPPFQTIQAEPPQDINPPTHPP